VELITIKTFDNSIDAHLLKSKLESEGIPCYLFDENMVSINPLYNVTVDGIKLKINAFDKEKVIQIINEIESKNFTNDNDDEISCPNCNSKDLYSDFKSMKDLKGLLSALFAFMFFIYPLYFKRVYKCKNCGYEFKKINGI
jgi:DNA-directed RNA polymerase subunit RPC12/RpoP